MFTNIKNFCEETNFPEKTLKRYIKEGKIPYLTSGRSYIIHKEKTLEALSKIAEENTKESTLPYIPCKYKTNKRKRNLESSFETNIQYLKQITKKVK